MTGMSPVRTVPERRSDGMHMQGRQSRRSVYPPFPPPSGAVQWCGWCTRGRGVCRRIGSVHVSLPIQL